MALTPLSVDIKNLFVANTIGAFGGEDDWAIYIGVQQDKPDKSITIYDLPADYEGRVLSSGKVLLKLSFQLIVRGTAYEETIDKFSEINALTDATQDLVGVDRTYRSIARQQEFVPLGKDEKNRYLFSGDFLVTLAS